MAAAYFSIPEIQLEKDEARAIAEALSEVNRHYAIPGINPAHASIASLLFIVMVTYGKRVPYIVGRGRSAGRGGGAAEVNVKDRGVHAAPSPQSAQPAPPSAAASDWFAPPVDAPIN